MPGPDATFLLSAAAFAAACLVLAAPVARLLALRGFLLRLSLFPRALVAACAGLLAYVAGIVVVIRLFPAWLDLAAALVLAAALYVHLWRARAGYGARRGLPPGSLALAPAGPWTDPLYYRRQADRHGPVCKLSHVFTPAVLITGLDRAAEFLKQFEDRLETPPLPFDHYIPGRFVRYMAPARRADYRRRLAAVFADRSVIDDYAGLVDEASRNLFADISRTPSAAPARHIEERMFEVMAALFFGIRHGDPDLDRLRRLYRDIDYRRALFVARRRIERSLDEIQTLIESPGRDRQCYFKVFQSTGGADTASDPASLRNFIYLMQTSWIDVADLALWMLYMLSRHPATLDRIRDAASSGHDPRRLARCVVLETLRLEQSEYLMRRATAEIRFEGYRIPPGWLVRVGVRESHRDSAVFDDPDAFRPERFLAHAFGRHQFAPLGVGRRTCLGQALVAYIGERLVLALCRGFTIEMAADGASELGVFHWRPSRRFLVNLRPLGDAGAATGASSAAPASSRQAIRSAGSSRVSRPASRPYLSSAR